jgi:hypothetical protein
MDNINSIPFIYKVSASLTAAVGSVGSATLIMQADSRFELAMILATGGLDSTTENLLVAPNSFTVSIRDQTTGRDLMSGEIPQRVLAGNAFNGFAQKRGVVFEPQSNILFTFTNLTAAVNNITVTLHGYKIIL